jgi:hypothetical protein
MDMVRERTAPYQHETTCVVTPCDHCPMWFSEGLASYVQSYITPKMEIAVSIRYGGRLAFPTGQNARNLWTGRASSMSSNDTRQSPIGIAVTESVFPLMRFLVPQADEVTAD